MVLRRCVHAHMGAHECLRHTPVVLLVRHYRRPESATGMLSIGSTFLRKRYASSSACPDAGRSNARVCLLPLLFHKWGRAPASAVLRHLSVCMEGLFAAALHLLVFGGGLPSRAPVPGARI